MRYLLIFIYGVYVNLKYIKKKAFKIKQADRGYRESFSKAYKILYIEGSLGYLIEILDSSQEGSFL